MRNARTLRRDALHKGAMVHRVVGNLHARLTEPESFRAQCRRLRIDDHLASARLPPPMSPLDPLQENRFLRTKLNIAIGLSLALPTGLPIAKPPTGDHGVYLDHSG